MKFPGNHPRITIKVASKSKKGLYHKVELWGDEWNCDCLYQYFKPGQTCSHVEQAKKWFEKNYGIKKPEPIKTS